MPRANRFYLPGYAWHITHRCHKREFLLKFDKDKRRWVQWLFEAKKLLILKNIRKRVYCFKADFSGDSEEVRKCRKTKSYAVFPDQMDIFT